MKEHPSFSWLKHVFCLQDVFADLYTIISLGNTVPCQCRRINDNSMRILNWCLFYEIINTYNSILFSDFSRNFLRTITKEYVIQTKKPIMVIQRPFQKVPFHSASSCRSSNAKYHHHEQISNH